MKRHQTLATMFLIVLATSCTSSNDPDTTGAIQITKAFVRAPIASSTTATAYFHLSNTGSTPITLTTANSNSARSVELHEHQHENGTMKMRRLTSVDVPPASSVIFEPGGKHLMLFGFDNKTSNTHDQLSFEFSNGETVLVSAEIRSILDTE